MYDLAIKNGFVYIEHNFIKTNIYIKDEIIANISPLNLESSEEYDATGKKVFPGFIDPHVHFNLNIGKYTSADDFKSGSIAGAFGGITTFIDFLDPVSNGNDLEKALKERLKLAKDSVTDYAFHATVMNPKDHVEDIVRTMNKLNIPSVKLFTTYSDSGRRTFDKEIKKLLKLSRFNNFIVLAHIENDDLITINDDFTFRDLLRSRPSISEITEVEKLCEYIKETNGKLYMVHLSSGETLKMIVDKYRNILNRGLYVESCPHYYIFDSDHFLREDGYLYTMAPPLREKESLYRMYENIDYIYSIGTDHCPFMKEEKNQEKLNGLPLGIGGIEHSFNLMYSLFKDDIIDKFTLNPAKAFNLYPNKGIIKEGSDADLVIYKDEEDYVINTNHSKCDYSLYEGFKTSGYVESTISRGRFVIKNREFIQGNGKYIR